MIKTASDHYIFIYQPNSFAEQEIEKIILLQEKCYADFLSFFMVKSDLKITYHFFNSALECGQKYRKLHPEEYDEDEKDEEINGFASYSDTIYAVYNSEIRCNGYHEDVHLLAADVLGFPTSVFIREGLAMFFDQEWLGIENKKWAKVVIDKNLIDNPVNLLDDEYFNQYNCMLTYALAGAFTEFIVKTAGIEVYRHFYQNFGKIKELENDYQHYFEQFLKQLANLEIASSEYDLIVERINK